MRHSIAAIAVIVTWLAPPVVSGQVWESLDPQPQVNSLWNVDFIDAYRGWACGEHGTILHTSDGGFNWEAQTSATELVITDIEFADSLNGWAICSGASGWGGAILCTRDGGSTWSTQLSGTTYGFVWPLAVMSSLECWTACGYCDLMHTVDGGETWESTNICVTQGWPGGWIYGLSFVGAGHGWLVGGGYYGPSAVLHTSNAGLIWTQQSAPLAGEFDGVVFVDANNGWIWGARWIPDTSGGFICRTTDGGETWTLQQSNEPYNLHELYFLDATRGWGVGSSGTIVRTIDGGDNWIIEQTPTDVFLHGVDFADAEHGWAVGDGGVILRYDPDGSIWTAIEDGMRPQTLVLASSHPNPFNACTTIRIQLPTGGPVRLSIYDVVGRLVCRLIDSDLPGGSHYADWDGRDSSGRTVGSGIYFARLQAERREATLKLSVVK